MSADATKLIIPGHGTVFHAGRGVALPSNPLNAFSLLGAPPAGWNNLGHTSKANTIAFTKEGGDKETLDTFLSDGVRTQVGSVSWGVTIPALQFDDDVLDLAFNGDTDVTTGGYIVPGVVNPVETQLFLLLVDNTGALGFWLENTDVTLGEPPSLDPTSFMELPLAASIKAADPTKIPTVDDHAGIFEIFRKVNSAAVPVVESVLPTGAAAGDIVTIKGSGLAGATAVKFDGTDAADFIVDGGRIYATLPAGSAGAAPVTVTTAAGTSAPKAYTRA